MDKMYKIKRKKEVKKVPEGSLKWYLKSGFKIVKEKKKKAKDDKTNSEETITK